MHLGQHHGVEYVYSSPPVILAAIAARTSSLRLGTGVTIMSNLDPFLVAEEFATLDAISSGRAEVVAGRGNYFPTTFELFGQDATQARERFDEAVSLFARLWSEQEVHWEGRFRSPIAGQPIRPAPTQPLRDVLWVAGGHSPETIELAAAVGAGLVLPTAFGDPSACAAIAELYRARFAAHGHQHEARVAATWHFFVADSSQDAKRRFERRYGAYHHWTRQGAMKANGWTELPESLSAPFDLDHHLAAGPGVAGSPDEVTDRLNMWADRLKLDVHVLQVDIGGIPEAELLSTLDLVGDKVLPSLTN